MTAAEPVGSVTNNIKTKRRKYYNKNLQSSHNLTSINSYKVHIILKEEFRWQLTHVQWTLHQNKDMYQDAGDQFYIAKMPSLKRR